MRVVAAPVPPPGTPDISSSDGSSPPRRPSNRRTGIHPRRRLTRARQASTGKSDRSKMKPDLRNMLMHITNKRSKKYEGTLLIYISDDVVGFVDREEALSLLEMTRGALQNPDQHGLLNIPVDAGNLFVGVQGDLIISSGM